MISKTEAYGLVFGFPARDTSVGASLRDHGEFAKPELDFLIQHARREAGVLLDVGAHIGSTALPFAKAKPAWRIIAAEALAPIALLLEDNRVANAITNVEVLSLAVGAEDSLAEYPAALLSESGNFGAIGFYTTETTAKRKVGVRTLDSIAPAEVDLVKVDVEGYEPEVIRGATRVINSARPIWLIEAHANQEARNRFVAQTLAEANYSLFWFYSPFATPLAPKRAPTSLTRGDMGIVALPSGTPNRWNLPAVADLGDLTNRPRSHEAFPYLTRYGYPSVE